MALVIQYIFMEDSALYLKIVSSLPYRSQTPETKKEQRILLANEK